MQRPFILLAVVLSAVFGTGQLLAQDDVPATTESPDSTTTPLAPAEREPLKVRNFYREKWENAFDLRIIQLSVEFDDSSEERSAASYLLGAQWNRTYSFGTALGIGAIGTPTNVAIRKDGRKDTLSLYGLGISLGQEIWEYGFFRFIAFVNVGAGIYYHRFEDKNETRTGSAGIREPKIVSERFNYVDPGLAVTFYRWRSIDIGATISFFQKDVFDFMKEDKKEGSDEKLLLNSGGPGRVELGLAGTTFGLTFRRVMH